jgi:hypothetical protein
MLEKRINEFIADYKIMSAKPKRKDSLTAKKPSNLLSFNIFGSKNGKKDEIRLPELRLKLFKVIIFPKKLHFCEEYLIKHNILKYCQIYEANVDLVFMNTDIISLEYRKLFTDYYLVIKKLSWLVSFK